jgi:hypothetical protein
MARRALPKIEITPELKEKQLLLRKFLRSVPEIRWKELRPIGFEINISTIPKDKADEFLSIANIGYNLK